MMDVKCTRHSGATLGAMVFSPPEIVRPPLLRGLKGLQTRVGKQGKALSEYVAEHYA
jgi:hypothetical protein